METAGHETVEHFCTRVDVRSNNISRRDWFQDSLRERVKLRGFSHDACIRHGSPARLLDCCVSSLCLAWSAKGFSIDDIYDFETEGKFELNAEFDAQSVTSRRWAQREGLPSVELNRWQSWFLGHRPLRSWNSRNCFLTLNPTNSDGVRFPKTARKAMFSFPRWFERGMSKRGRIRF